ncbi:conserved hypothetical protein [Histoplasma capsulatum var. duboisii H88]|uniref:Non-homologous end-joining factor 1 n=2 Tax=Ajellomyces capsulatus TaxID=5037 RepID=F0UKP8_AJEC8|nr:conserved hypothetical protein [Histoplasma capsulatum var. duboisii H88]QSS56635.1 XLF superfamily domain-containing protein [Histoplasma capsulatum var. duboisii H88]
MSKWSKLQLPSDSPAPPLLYKYLTSKLGCEIYVTDLAHVWSQSLSRKEILKNASKYNTSIDPGEDEEQYFVFLQKISDALRGSEGSSLLLTSDPGGEKLKLLTSTKLPTPLVPLEWTFTLSQQPPNALAKHILLPILKGEANHEARILSLIGHVKQKDWTLNKLFDKIESSGVDLSMVFHGMGGVRLSRKESVYSQASQLIKGVAPFDENLWNNEYQVKDADYNLGVHIANELSFTSSFADRQIDDFAPDNWWNKLGTDSFGNARQTARKDKEQKNPVSEISPPPAEKDEASHSDDDEFQTMETPPRLRSPSRSKTKHDNLHKSPKSTGGSHVESDQDSAEESLETPTSSKNRSKHKTNIAGHPPKKKVQASSSAETTASEEDGNYVRSTSRHRSKSKGLGNIGGRHPPRRKQSLMELAGSTQSEAEYEAPINPKTISKTKGSLWAIGGKKKTQRPFQESPIGSTASDISDAPGTTPNSNPTKQTVDNDTPTESENEADLSTSRTVQHTLPEPSVLTSSPPLKPQSKSRGIGAIGQIGGKKKQPEPSSPSSEPKTAKPRHPNHDHDGNGDERETPPVFLPGPTKLKHQGGKLGMIGGRGAPAASNSRKERSRSQEVPELSPPPKPAMTPGDSEQPRAELGEKGIEAKQEIKDKTPEERANRKREELRKQLEARNKTGGTGPGVGGPAKKRRRF